jgi:hypothetical protein
MAAVRRQASRDLVQCGVPRHDFPGMCLIKPPVGQVEQALSDDDSTVCSDF